MAKKYIIQPICDDCVWIKDNACKCPGYRRYGLMANFMKCERYALKINYNCLDCQFINLGRMTCGKEESPLFKKKVLEPDPCSFFALAKPKKPKVKRDKAEICRAKHCPWLIKCSDKKGTCMWKTCLVGEGKKQ